MATEVTLATILSAIYNLFDVNVIGVMESLSESFEVTDVIKQQIISEFSRDYPREIIYTIAGAGTYTYALPSTAPEDDEFDERYLPGFSSVKSVEYPEGEQDPVYISIEKYFVKKTTESSSELRFRSDSPAAGYNIEVIYTTRQGVRTSEDTTIPIDKLEAIACLSAAALCGNLATKFAETEDSSIRVDAVEYQNKTDLWRSLQKDFYKRYKDQIPRNNKTTSAICNWDTTFAGSGADYLTHPGAWR